jgi:4-hydroxybenzoate polyprenyltransferase
MQTGLLLYQGLQDIELTSSFNLSLLLGLADSLFWRSTGTIMNMWYDRDIDAK